MLDGAPGSGWQDDDADDGVPAVPAVRDRAALRAGSRRDAREAEQVWRPSLAERLGEARWSLPPSAAIGALVVVAAVVVLLVLSAAASGGASVPTPTPGVAVPVRTPAPLSSSSSAHPSGPSSTQPSASAPGAGAGLGQVVVVDVAGQVESPGLVRLPAGSRADDAVRAAGGARPGADLRRVNLARVLVDGEQLVVPAPGEQLPSAQPAPAGARPTSVSGVPAAGGSAAGTAAGAAAGPVDLNSATLAELDALPGVGPVLAQRILDWRSEHGRFTSVDHAKIHRCGR
ncbi:MAG: helix-hairpin-helix domain-containing protein [Quadrisphaera sp.]